MATSISAIVCTILLFVSFRKKVGSFGLKDISISFVKILVASLLMGIIAKGTYNILFKMISGNLSLIISIGVGALVYFIVIYFMKIEEVETLVSAVKKKFARN
ncbi:polysaccharide biosynthesis C-terminal domain-containing protein [Irregularibacter muris]|uniref:Polysaccharide biosynthesis C-terminal domain-containing protein n=1 Tax=Irregularibacter muris TaxID=1796619 RepID=A0AAE3L392_9FIRM|nr:polysaccharide biosynthesis C-terminal domain-containing protein [Irregularibacter muris]MCR1900074.1 polysaccharide biosynthesis C-terminal domain-containing protein [Irregularibacter muris]